MEETVSKEVREDIASVEACLRDMVKGKEPSADLYHSVKRSVRKLSELEQGRYQDVVRKRKAAKVRKKRYEAYLKREEKTVLLHPEQTSLKEQIRYHKKEIEKEEGKIQKYTLQLKEIEKSLQNLSRITDQTVVAFVKRYVKETERNVEKSINTAAKEVETAESAVPYIGPVLSGASKTIRATGNVIRETGRAADQAKNFARDAFTKLKVKKLVSPEEPKDVIRAATGILAGLGASVLKVTLTLVKGLIRRLAVAALVVLTVFGPVVLGGYLIFLLSSGGWLLFKEKEDSEAVVVAENDSAYHGIYGSGIGFAEYVIKEQEKNEGQYDWRMGGNVSAQYVTYYNEHFNASFPVVGTEWCAIFVSVMAERCGLVEAGLIPVSAGTGAFALFYEEKGLLHKGYSAYTPKPGDLILYEYIDDNDPLYDHIEIVVKVEGDTVTCIGGNTGKCVGYDIRDRHDPNIGAFCEVPYPNVDTDLLDFAAVLAGEVGNDYEGALAVATVIKNRLMDGRYGNSIYEVIHATGQFEAVGGPIYNEVMRGNIDTYPNAYQAAVDAMNGKTSQYLTGQFSYCRDFRTATYYENGIKIDAADRYPNGIEISGNWFFIED